MLNHRRNAELTELGINVDGVCLRLFAGSQFQTAIVERSHIFGIVAEGKRLYALNVTDVTFRNERDVR